MSTKAYTWQRKWVEAGCMDACGGDEARAAGSSAWCLCLTVCSNFRPTRGPVVPFIALTLVRKHSRPHTCCCTSTTTLHPTRLDKTHAKLKPHHAGIKSRGASGPLPVCPLSAACSQPSSSHTPRSVYIHTRPSPTAVGTTKFRQAWLGHVPGLRLLIRRRRIAPPGPLP